MFGWTSETVEMAPGFNYTMFKHGDHMIGGAVSPKAEEGCEAPPPCWMMYINTADVAADVAKAKAAGGTIIVESMQVPNAGTFAVIADSQGAVFGLWQAEAQSE